MTELERLFKRAVLQTVLNEGVPALLGKVDETLFYVDDNGTHHKDRVWARIGTGDAPVEAVVRCVNVPQTLNLPVIVADRDGVLTVVRTDTRRALTWGGGTLVNVEPHNWTHDRFGPDPTYKTGLSFLPLAAVPASPPDLTVVVEQCVYRYQGTWTVFETTTSSSLAAYLPAGTEVTHYVILALDRVTNTLTVIDGADVTGGNRALPSASTVLATPGVLAQYFPIAAIRLYNGQTQIFPRDIFMDLRLWAGESSASGSGAGVLGPTSSTDNAIARWDGTTGILLQDSYPTIDDSGNMDLAGNELRDYSHQMVVADTGAAYEIDWSAATVFELTLTANVTFTFANLGAGRAVTLILIQDGTGGRTATWPAVSWANGTAPRLSPTAAAVNVVTLICQNDGSTVSGFSEGDHFDERGVVFSDGGSDTSNFFAGNDAGRTAATGTQIVAIGQQAGDAITSGGDLVLIGHQAGSSITTALDVVLIGDQAGEFITTADDNIGIGSEVMGQNQAGIENVAIGSLALKGNGGLGGSDVDDCVAVGALALRNVLNGADENTATGAYSGFSVTTAARLILLGAYAGYRQTTASDRFLVDNRLRADAATELTHALIYGVMGANPEDQALTINVDALNVGTDADADVVMTWKANSNNGVLTWMEDEDYFQFGDDALFPDNEAIKFGTGVDMDIYYDGTDGHIRTDLVAASDLNIDCGTNKTIELQTPVYEDLQVSISNIRVPAANAPTERLYAFGIGGGVTFPALGFTVNDYLYFDVQTHHAMKLNTALDNHLHFTLPNTTDIGDKFQFQLDVIAAGIDTQWAAPTGTPFTSEHTIVANDNTYHRLMEMADIPASNDTVSTIYKCKLTRIAATGDEYASEVYISFMDCHYQKNTMGSRQEGTK
jgi:hypothetical protein